MKTWDIFCRVIDNYGDIGVCWRLARQLASEHKQQVRLWVDDLNALVRIWPDAQLTDRQELAGVEVRQWTNTFPTDIEIAQVVIEAFACAIPESYLQAMAAQKKAGQAPYWINLEYLSAENWVEDCHNMASVHPSTGLRKTFFFPGFTAKTGGLLREQALITQQRDTDSHGFLHKMGIQKQEGNLLISLFAYENSAIAPLIAAWQESPTPIHCLVPQGKILTSVNQALESPLALGNSYVQGNLRLDLIPFLNQIQYDHLLWACDLNFVRGEDSFIRAQWAGKPFIWHIYPQDEAAHMVKLEAFLALFLAKASDDLSAGIREFWEAWNENGDIGQMWRTLMALAPEWQELTHNWRQQLLEQDDLANQLLSLTTKPVA
jgi:uncharacterized repeat protein (TIGR03837 family)